MERRGCVKQLVNLSFNSGEEEKLNLTKPFIISKESVKRAYLRVKENKGAAGVDQQSLIDFESNLGNNLYKIWNRMSSGCYFPPPVKAVPIPKKSGGTRILGVPTVGDRIAQMVVKSEFEKSVEPCFYPDSYGYRENKSAIEAVGVTRERCWKYGWLIEYDIKGLFDNLDHDLLMKAVRSHTDNRWVILYIERWLRAPLQLPDGTLQERTKGVPQGGVISPVLSNLFLHYAFDVWMTSNFPENPWCRYADDAVIHCKTEQQAQQILAALVQRYRKCGLELHPEKTKIVCCKRDTQEGGCPRKFDFLGFTFRRRMAKGRDGKAFMTFTPAVSESAQKNLRAKTRAQRFYRRVDLALVDIARMANPVLRGWYEYYGKYRSSELYPVFRHFNKTLVVWARRKYEKVRNSKDKAIKLLKRAMSKRPKLFFHWGLEMRQSFV
jgi:RNA-directed DNA polymerase